jgi:hypothetical protein
LVDADFGTEIPFECFVSKGILGRLRDIRLRNEEFPLERGDPLAVRPLRRFDLLAQLRRDAVELTLRAIPLLNYRLDSTLDDRSPQNQSRFRAPQSLLQNDFRSHTLGEHFPELVSGRFRHRRGRLGFWGGSSNDTPPID